MNGRNKRNYSSNSSPAIKSIYKDLLEDSNEYVVLEAIWNLYNPEFFTRTLSQHTEPDIIERVNYVSNIIRYTIEEESNGGNLFVMKNKGWKKKLQKQIERIANPSVGHDRQAIALACYRDYIHETSRTKRINELEECARQIEALLKTEEND